MSSNANAPQISWLSLVAPILTALLGIAAYYFVGVPQQQEAVSRVYVQSAAEQRALSLESNFASLAAQLDGIGRLPEVRRAMAEGDHQNLRRLSDQWTLMFEKVNAFSFFPVNELGIAGLSDAYRQLLRNNIEKDMLHRALKSDNAVFDIYKVDGRYVVSVAKAVQAGNRKTGLSLLSLDLDWAERQIGYLDNGKGRAAIQYRLTPGEPVTVAGQTLASAQYQATHPLAQIPSLSIIYSLEESPSGGVIKLLLVSLILVVMVLISLFSLFRLKTRITAKFDSDAEQLQRYVCESLDGTPAKPALRFASLGDIVEGYDRALSKFREKRAVKNGQTAVEPQELPSQQMDVIVEEGEPAIAEVVEEERQSLPPKHIFRAYDIRGIVGDDLQVEHAEKIGQAFATFAQQQGHSTVVIARDGRLSSDDLVQQLQSGILAAGSNVVDIGLVPSPLLYFAVEHLQAGAGVMVTGSHNPPEYNGFKMVSGGRALVDSEITNLHEMICDGELATGSGALSVEDVTDHYIDQIVDDVVFASPIKVVLDCCNGVASELAPLLYASMGAEVIPLFAEVDGSFPNHLPDPGDHNNLTALVEEVSSQGADLGLAFDGDADRVVAVTGDGEIIDADQLLMLFARDVLTRNPGADIVFDQKCSRGLPQVISSHGGRPVAWKSGHSRIKQKMVETGALLGGEFSGHFFFKERWFGFDDGLYAGARLIEMLTLEGQSLTEAVSNLPQNVSSPELSVAVDEAHKFAIVEALESSSAFAGGEVSTLDGVRVDFADSWGLVRASNTSAKLTLRFEADSEEGLTKVREQFVSALAEQGLSL